MFSSVIINEISEKLKANQLACNVFNYFKIENAFPPLPWFQALSSSIPTMKMPHFPTDDATKEYRIETVLVKGIRKFGLLPDRNLYYGIDLRSNKKCNKDCFKRPISLILLGNNGIGKSSLYTSLEKVGTGSSDLSIQRGFSVDNEMNFLLHSNIEPEQGVIKVVTANKHFFGGSLESLKNPIVYKACFCSDYDVEVLEKSNDYQTYILRQLGLEPIVSLENSLYSFKSHLEDIQRRDILKMHDMDKNEMQKEYIHYLSGLVSEFLRVVKEVRNEHLDQIFPNIKNMLEFIVDDYFIKDNSGSEKFIVDNKSGYFDFHIKFIKNDGHDKESVIQMSPRSYLNTFRFKLFVFSLKLTLGLNMKIKNRIDFPYIVDDLFDSSDFNHRVEIGDYIEKVLKKHDSIIENEIKKIKENSELDEESRSNRIEFLEKLLMPQIIFFTQDELIGRSLFEGVRKNQLIRYGRLYNPDDYDPKSDIHKIILKVSDASKGSVDVAYRFINLYDIIQEGDYETSFE